MLSLESQSRRETGRARGNGHSPRYTGSPSFIDSNVVDGQPITGCWRHPWWDYICDNFYNTFTETSFTYGAGLGFRYHFPGGTFLKASHNVWKLDSLGEAGDSSITGARVEFGWGF